MLRRGSGFASIFVVVALAGEARANGPLGPQGSRIGTSGYNVDLYQGPVLATTRITGLAGAYTAVAENVDGIPFNPAAASMRAPHSTTKVDWDITGGLTFPGSVSGTDFDNNGKVGFAYENFFWATFGGLIQFGHGAFGVIGSFQDYDLGVPGSPQPLPNSQEVVSSVSIRVLRVDPVGSYGFLDDQLHVGVGLRLAGFFGVGQSGLPGKDADQERLLLQQFALGLQGGALLAPANLPFRIGAALRSPAWSLSDSSADSGRVPKDANGDRTIGNIFLPNQLQLPWEAEVGIAVQLWKRPFNIHWQDEDLVSEADAARWRQTNEHGRPEPTWQGARRLLKARYRQIPRQRVMFTASALVTGATPNAVGLESMLTQQVDRSGQHTVVSVRAGVESEVIPWWLVLRAGSYLEPSRYEEGSSRVHGTASFDLRVLQWSMFGLFDDETLFRVSLSGDIARDYFGWGVGAGFFR